MKNSKEFSLLNARVVVTTLLLLIITNVYAAEESAQAQLFEQHFDGVLGTSLDISIYTPVRQKVAAEDIDEAVEIALNEIARLEQALSTYRDDSELMGLNLRLTTQQASQDLLNIIHYCDDWYQRSQAKFSCRLGKINQLWDKAQESQVIPERPFIRHTARRANQALIEVVAEQNFIKLDAEIALDPAGLAKGYIIDQALKSLRQKLPEAIGIKVDIGGDAVYWGSPSAQTAWKVGIANPLNIADNTGFINTLTLRSMAVAASGHTSRTRTVGRREFSQILTPRDGWPVENGIAATVIAKDALTADAVATALSVQTLGEAISWVDTLDGVEALVVDTDGRQMHSEYWQDFIDKDSLPITHSELTFSLDYVLPKFSAANYNRPYVAIWITDTKQKPLKNLLILGATQRWARENKRWWRRVGRRNPNLLDGVARATRGAGEYSLHWDGIDDFGAQVPPGDYLLHLEASRENGGSNYHSIPFTLGGDSSIVDVEEDGELGVIHLEVNN